MVDVNVYNLGVENELRFVVHQDNSVTLEMMTGFAEIFGAEVEQNKLYTFSPCSSIALYTWQGCALKLVGNVEDLHISENSMIMLHVSMHACLEERRIIAGMQHAKGPVSLVVGPPDVGKTSFCYMLLNYAARLGKRPMYFNLDVGQTSLSLPGTISCLPVERQADIIDGFNNQSFTVYPFGGISPRYNIFLYFLLIKKLGQQLNIHMRSNVNTKSSGAVIDTCNWMACLGYRAIPHLLRSFNIDIIFVFKEKKLFRELKKHMPSSIQLVYVPKIHGVYERSRNLRTKNRDNCVFEYFYGKEGDKIPHTIEVQFSDVDIYTVESPPSDTYTASDWQNISASDINVVHLTIDSHLENCILGLSSADEVDENLMVTSLIHFVYVTRIDVNTEVMTLLSPHPGPLPSKILIK